jgi:putative multiple sugar transport system ATP-binding protein
MNEGRFVAEYPVAEASQERIMRAIVNSGGGVHGQ